MLLHAKDLSNFTSLSLKEDNLGGQGFCDRLFSLMQWEAHKFWKLGGR